MAQSLIGGLIADGYAAKRLRVSDPDSQQLDILRQRCAVYVTHSNEDAAGVADIVLFAVKPQVLKPVAMNLQPLLQARKPLVISIAAGVRLTALGHWLGGGEVPLIRAMPNTPALVQCAATALYANALVDAAQRVQAEAIMRAVGLVVWLDNEDLMDAVTALSGSGPAYFFILMEALESAAVELGLAPGIARQLTLQTAYGAAKMAMGADASAADLRARVTSPGGTTAAAVQVLEDGGLRNLFSRALAAAHARSVALAHAPEMQ